MSDAILIDGLSKRYRRSSAGFRMRTLKSALLQRSLTAGLGEDKTISALDDISFTVGRGEAFGVVGSNGSGESIDRLVRLPAGTFDWAIAVRAARDAGSPTVPEPVRPLDTHRGERVLLVARDQGPHRLAHARLPSGPGSGHQAAELIL